ncbi:MAG TPA: CBS domain-containing protein, partial [Phycisphaerales bacterium]|nr:CBS domain-containing protein [Phycisphaerales bacterium]
LIETYKVCNVMDTKTPVISAGMSLTEVIKVVSTTESFYYPVVGNDKKLIGAITLDGIRNTFATQELNDWLIAMDIVEPIVADISPDTALSEAFNKTKELGTEYMPVIDPKQEDKFVGVLDANAAHRKLSAEVLAKQHEADRMYNLQHA